MVSRRGSWRAHIFPKDDWNFLAKNFLKLGYFCITKKDYGRYLQGKRYKCTIKLK